MTTVTVAGDLFTGVRGRGILRSSRRTRAAGIMQTWGKTQARRTPMERKTWRWLVVVVTLISMVGTSAALAQKAPGPDGAPASAPAPGQVTPLAVDTFEGRVEPVVGNRLVLH